MFNIGIDFDNTLVNYDTSFYELALEKGLISSSLEKSKNAVRNFLREQDKDNDFTLLQGEIYGPRILKSKPAHSAIKTIKRMQKWGFNVFIVSHKTRYPYKGPKFDLHESARNWLDYYSFLSFDGANIPEDKIFFNTSKNEKIDKVHNIKCDFFIDDLPEILDLINPNIKKILFNNSYPQFKSKYDFVSNDWDLIGEFLYQSL